MDGLTRLHRAISRTYGFVADQHRPLPAAIGRSENAVVALVLFIYSTALFLLATALFWMACGVHRANVARLMRAG